MIRDETCDGLRMKVQRCDLCESHDVAGYMKKGTKKFLEREGKVVSKMPYGFVEAADVALADGSDDDDDDVKNLPSVLRKKLVADGASGSGSGGGTSGSGSGGGTSGSGSGGGASGSSSMPIGIGIGKMNSAEFRQRFFGEGEECIEVDSSGEQVSRDALEPDDGHEPRYKG